MPEETTHPLIIVLAAEGSGGAVLLQALSGHSLLHGVSDGGLCAEVLELLDVLGDETRLEQVLADAGNDDAEPRARAIQQLERGERLIALRGLATQARTAREPRDARRIATQHVQAVASSLAEKAGKRGIALYAANCATRPIDLSELVPEALIVHLVRDGRAVALARSDSAAGPGGLRQRAQAWLDEVAPLLSFEMARPERVVKVAYEDLVVSPQIELEKVCRAAGLAPEPEPMAAALRGALLEGDEVAFRADALDGWQTIELESVLQPVLALLGYRPVADLDAIPTIRAQWEAYEAARAEADALRARLRAYETAAASAPSGRGVGDGTDAANELRASELKLDAMAQELVTLRREVARYEDALDELRQLRFLMRDQADLAGDIGTLRWKAKRYDQLRAAASPILRIKGLRTHR